MIKLYLVLVILGEGQYKSRDKNGNKTPSYIRWYSMLRRCYDPYTINKSKGLAYKDVFVHHDWLNYQKYAKWDEENYYAILNEIMCLDKDILYKGNKLYSPNNCCFVPQRINNLFCKNDKCRGKYPIGVTWNKKKRCFVSTCFVDGKNIEIGYFNNEMDAFKCYKKYKENLIQKIAFEYKGHIPTKVYESLINYNVEIND